MPKNKVNNNIKLKSGGGIINDASGLTIDDTYQKVGKAINSTTIIKY